MLSEELGLATIRDSGAAGSGRARAVRFGRDALAAALAMALPVMGAPAAAQDLAPLSADPGLVMSRPMAQSWGNVPSLAFVELEAADLERTAAFYQQVLGMEEWGRCTGCGSEGARFDQIILAYPHSKQPWIVLVRHEGVGPVEIGNVVWLIGFITPDIAAVQERARAGGFEVTRGVIENPQGSPHVGHTLIAHLRDPDGRAVAVAQALKQPHVVLPGADTTSDPWDAPLPPGMERRGGRVPTLQFTGEMEDDWGEVPSFGYIKHEVTDLDEATRFYSEVLGMVEGGPQCMRCGPATDPEAWSQRAMTFGGNQPWLELNYHPAAEPLRHGNSVPSFGVITTDIAAVLERARAGGYEIVRDATEIPKTSPHMPRAITAVIRDTVGQSITVAQILAKPNLCLPTSAPVDCR